MVASIPSQDIISTLISRTPAEIEQLLSSLSSTEQESLLKELETGGALLEIKRSLARTIPQTDEELYQWLYHVLGARIPRRAVCPHHNAPFDLVSDVFFGRTTQALVLAPRSGSKCHIGSDRVLLDTGELVPISNLTREAQVVSLEASDLHLASTAATPVTYNGIRPVVQLTTRTGRQVTVTKEHPFFTPQGWKPIQELKEGDFIASPRRYSIEGQNSLPSGLSIFLGLMVGDGCCRSSSPGFTSSDPELIAILSTICRDFAWELKKNKWGMHDYQIVNTEISRQSTAGYKQLYNKLRQSFSAPFTMKDIQKIYPHSVPKTLIKTHLHRCRRNGLILSIASGIYTFAALTTQLYRPSVQEILARAGLFRKDSRTKRVPSIIFTAPNSDVAQFLGAYFSCDGTVSPSRPRLQFASVSRDLLADVQHLLLRFGIVSTLSPRNGRYNGRPHRHYVLDIGGEYAHLFKQQIPVIGAKRKALESLPVSSYHKSDVDIIPGFPCPWYRRSQKYGISRAKAVKLASRYRHIERLLSDDILWDRICEIRPLEEQPTYNVEVPSYHNLVVNDVISHNTFSAATLCSAKGTMIPYYEMLVVGSQAKQALRCYTHCSRQLSSAVMTEHVNPRSIMKESVTWKNGSVLTIATQTIGGVSGPHPQMAVADELEEWDESVFNHFLFTVQEVEGSGEEVIIALSTRHRPGGLMTRFWEDAEEKGWKRYVWCSLEVMRQCQHCPGEQCFLWEDCQQKGLHADGFLSKSTLIRRKKSTPPEVWAAQGLCIKTDVSDSVFAEYQDEIGKHLTNEDYQEELSVFWGVDWGYRDPAVILFAQTYGGRIHVFDEICISLKTTDQLIELVEKRNYQRPTVGFCDPSRPDLIREWAQKGFVMRGSTAFSRNIYAGLQEIKARLRSSSNEISLTVHPRCRSLRKALRDHVWRLPGEKEGADSEKPTEKQPGIHCIDALRYLVGGLATVGRMPLYIPER